MTVGASFLLGAGFSKAISDKFPVMKELTSLLMERLREMGEIRERDITPAAFGDDIELWLSFLGQDHPWVSEGDNLRNRALFHEASRALGSIILERQNEVLSQESIPEWLALLVKQWHGRRSPVITLNYDYMIEKAFSETVKAQGGGRASAANLSPVPITPIHARLGGWRFGPEEIETMQLMKLHGSVSWYYSGSPTFYGETIYDINLNIVWTPDDPDDLTSRALDKIPLIVPPTSGKNVFFQNELVRTHWRLAAQRIGGSATLYVLGYSLPPGDEMIRLMLATVGPSQIYVVNPDASIAERLKEVVSLPRNVNWFGPDIGSFVKWWIQTKGD